MSRHLSLLVWLAALWGGVLAAQDKASWNPSERYFGTDAFVPDWHRAEDIDAKASQRFVKMYWHQAFSLGRNGHYPALKGDYEQGGVGTPQGVTAAERSAGAVVWIQPYFQALHFNDLPQPEQRAFRSVSLFAARGESEPIGVGVRTLGMPKTITVEVSDLHGAAHILSRRRMTNRLMLGYHARLSRQSTATAYRQMVLLKTPGNRWTFPKHYSFAYIVDFHVPIDAAPGIYTGTVTVTADSVPVKAFAVYLDVLPFSLKTNNYHAGAFGCTYDVWAGGFSAYAAGMMELDSRYGFNMCGGFFNKGREIPFRHNADGMLVVDERHAKFATFHRTMRRMARYGMGQMAFWNWGASGNLKQFDRVLQAAGVPSIRTTAGKQEFADMLRAIKMAEKKHGWPELVINPFDEA